MFHNLRCGTPENKNLTEEVLWTMPEECQLDEELGDKDENSDESIDLVSPPSRKRPRRSRKDESSETLARIFEESSKCVADAFLESTNMMRDSRNGERKGEGEHRFRQWQEELGVLKTLIELDQTLKQSGENTDNPVRESIRDQMLALSRKTKKRGNMEEFQI